MVGGQWSSSWKQMLFDRVAINIRSNIIFCTSDRGNNSTMIILDRDDGLEADLA